VLVSELDCAEARPLGRQTKRENNQEARNRPFQIFSYGTFSSKN